MGLIGLCKHSQGGEWPWMACCVPTPPLPLSRCVTLVSSSVWAVITKPRRRGLKTTEVCFAQSGG